MSEAEAEAAAPRGGPPDEALAEDAARELGEGLGLVFACLSWFLSPRANVKKLGHPALFCLRMILHRILVTKLREVNIFTTYRQTLSGDVFLET